MSRPWRTVLPGAVWLLGACAPAPRPPAEPAAQPAPHAAARDVITLERGPCFGTCPVYRVTLARSGAVQFEGRRFVADSGVSSGTVPAARVDSLFGELESSGYFELADSYRSGDAVCTRYATDLPTVITEVRLGGRTKRIEHDRGCGDAPGTLSDLENRIDEVAGVRKWVER